ncbi:hypothetical protein [Mycoplasmopsis pullorum]|nr:hypothetical protein [Mycoplasmopsis pullorum]
MTNTKKRIAQLEKENQKLREKIEFHDYLFKKLNPIIKDLKKKVL